MLVTDLQYQNDILGKRQIIAAYRKITKNYE